MFDHASLMGSALGAETEERVFNPKTGGLPIDLPLDRVEGHDHGER